MTVNVTRKSPFTGQSNTIQINVTETQLAAYQGGAMIQDAFPTLSADEREFILSGSTPADWASAFPDEG